MRFRQEVAAHFLAFPYRFQAAFHLFLSRTTVLVDSAFYSETDSYAQCIVINKICSAHARPG
jgi:hypothetical protein